jgi:hypothetical protein
MGQEISPRLSPDGKYLFFLRTVDGELWPFWVSAHVVTGHQAGINSRFRINH